MTLIIRLRVFLFFLPLIILACETPLQEQKLPDMTFAHMTPIKLNVAKINVVVQYKPSLREPNVEHLFPTLPVEAIRQWAKDRLRPVGTLGEAKLIIIEASAVEKQLPQKGGFSATFTRQQAQRYDVKVKARLEVYNALGKGTALANVTRFTTVREDATINKRKRAWFDLTESIARNFDTTIEKNIQKHLNQFLK
jgi:hypothetical protein